MRNKLGIKIANSMSEDVLWSKPDKFNENLSSFLVVEERVHKEHDTFTSLLIARRQHPKMPIGDGFMERLRRGDFNAPGVPIFYPACSGRSIIYPIVIYFLSTTGIYECSEANATAKEKTCFYQRGRHGGCNPLSRLEVIKCRARNDLCCGSLVDVNYFQPT